MARNPAQCQGPKLRAGTGALLGFLLPLLMGGCPQFRDEAVTAVETAVRGLVDAALNAYFDELRGGTGF